MSDKNPLLGGHIIGSDVEPKVYLRNERRGDRAYCMSRSELAEFGHCPQRWLAGYKKNGSDELEWGSMIDTLLLQPSAWDNRYTVAPETYPSKKGDKPWTNRADYCKDWTAAQEKAGKTVLEKPKLNRVRHAVSKLLENAEVKPLVNGSVRQVFIVARFEDDRTEMEVGVKVLIDMVPRLQSAWPKCLADLKTCYSGDNRVYANAVFEHHLHWQAAMCLDAYTSATGEDRDTFLHVCQENYEPFHVSLKMLSQDFIDLGREQYVRALRKYCQCLKTGEWPGYESEQTVGPWALVSPMAYMVR